MVNMKKISMIALTILTLGVTSCDMDKMPYDAVPTEEALTTIVGFEEARAGIYSVYLGLTGGSYVLAPEVQADAFNRSEERRVGKECRSRWSPYH